MTDINERRNSNAANAGGQAGEPDDTVLANPDEGFLQRLRDAKIKLDDIATRRELLGSERSALLEGLAADHSVNKTAMLAAIRYCELSDEKKQNWDLTYQVMRKALGQPVQMDLFEAQLEQAVKKAEGKRRISKAEAMGKDPKAAAEALFVPAEATA